MIAAVVESADIEIGDIDIFLPGELEQVVTSFNDTAVDVPEETFYDAFARGVVATPEAIAVRDEAGQATYRELSEQCDRIAGVLYRRGVSVEEWWGLRPALGGNGRVGPRRAQAGGRVSTWI